VFFVSLLKPDNYLFTHYGYSADRSPRLTFLPPSEQSFTTFTPRDNTFTLNFDTSARYCTGWYDLQNNEGHPCPVNVEVIAPYTQCRSCQQKTGFNPAFYHAVTVSEQQQARNRLPHTLYLAHFAPGIVKVGITWAGRDLNRLLDQGARSCLIIKTYPNADVARQYEAAAARLPGIAETLQVKSKYILLNTSYDAIAASEELKQNRQRLINEAGISPDNNDPIYLDPYYLANNHITPGSLIDMSEQKSISGSCIGMIGSILLMQQDDTQFMLPLSKLVGYTASFSDALQRNNHTPQQAALF
jgi:hypothetical protein